MIARYGPTYGYIDLIGATAKRGAVESLRAELARRHHVRHAFLFESARSALHFLLRAYGRPGGEIIMPGYTCIVVPEWVSAAGYLPVFADIGEHSVNMTAETTSDAITPRTRGVVITHQFGLPCDVRRIVDLCRERNLLAIEDAAASFGATVGGVPVGGFGDAAIVSFYHTKVISAGSGGALLTNNDDLAERVNALLRETHVEPAGSWPAFCTAALWKVATSRLIYPAARHARRLMFDEGTTDVLEPEGFASGLRTRSCASFVAALFEKQLNRIDENLARRRKWAALYQRELRNTPGYEVPEVPDGVQPAWIQYPVFAQNKFDLCNYGLRRSVDFSWTFRYCAAESYGVRNCPNSMRAARTVVGLPTYPGMDEGDVERICSVLRGYTASVPSAPTLSKAAASGRSESGREPT